MSLTLSNRRRKQVQNIYLFVIVALSCTFIYTKLLKSYYQSNVESNKPIIYLQSYSVASKFQNTSKPLNETNKNWKYILIWTRNANPFHHIRSRGRNPFLSNKCEFNNCYLTDNRSFLRKQSGFDAILFSITSLLSKKFRNPTKRSPHQKYVAAATIPASTCVVTNPKFDNFFNWTWTHRFGSDVYWRNIRIYDMNGKVVGPKKNMTWLKEMKPTSENVEELLSRKMKAVAWIVSDCKMKLKHEKFVKSLKKELDKYELTVDEYSKCSKTSCGNFSMCKRLLTNDYCFYLALEDFFEEDFVTEKILRAVQNFAIPIVSGGANYSRFLPPGSYLNAKHLEVKVLAETIANVTDNITLHREYFRWTNHYTYKSAAFKSEICNICTALNDKSIVKKYSVYKKFRTWWNGDKQTIYYDTLMSTFLDDKEMRKLVIEKNFSALREVFKNKYDLEEFRKIPKFTQPKVFVFNILDLNFTTTDSSNDDVGNDTETTTIVVDDD